MTQTLESRVATALGHHSSKSSTQLAALIEETTEAINAAEVNAEDERQRALDPVRSPDPGKARQSMQDMEFTYQRLAAALPRLRLKHQQVLSQEQYDAWVSLFDPLIRRHAAAAGQLQEVYTTLVPQLIEALITAKQVDQEVRRVVSAKPWNLSQANGDGRDLPTVETSARGFAVAPEYSLMQMKIPAFDQPNQHLWPPAEPSLALQVASGQFPVLTDPRQFSNEWWKVAQEQAEQARQQQERERQRGQSSRQIPGPALVARGKAGWRAFAMTRPHCVSLSDAQLRLVRQHAAPLPVGLLDRFLRSIADGLTGEPSDTAVMTAINRALDCVRSFQNSEPIRSIKIEINK
jgi:hypothetical protein